MHSDKFNYGTPNMHVTILTQAEKPHAKFWLKIGIQKFLYTEETALPLKLFIINPTSSFTVLNA